MCWPKDAWDADPFAGTVAMEVRRGACRWRVEDRAAVADMLARLRIVAIENGVGRGSIPRMWLRFEKTGGKALEVGVEEDGTLSCGAGAIWIERGFMELLDGVTGGAAMVQDVEEESDGDVETPERAEEGIPAGGYRRVEVFYGGGPRKLRSATILDPAGLARLAEAFGVVHREAGNREIPGVSIEFTVYGNDGTRLYARWLDADYLATAMGRLTIDPAFGGALSREVERIEGRPIDVLGENPPNSEQVRRGVVLAEQLRGVRGMHVWRGAKEWRVDDAEEVSRLMVRVEEWEVPLREFEAAEGSDRVVLTRGDGVKVEVRFLGTKEERGRSAIELGGPMSADLARVEGFGQVWIAREWMSRLASHESEREWRAEKERHKGIVRAVAPRLAEFLREVLSVQVRDGRGRIRVLGRAEARRLVEALEIERVEAREWSGERWREELQRLSEQRAGWLGLTPGLGFELQLLVAGERELLIWPYGRVLLRRSVRNAVEGVLGKGW